MKPNFTISFLIVYLSQIYDSSAVTQTNISCTTSGKASTTIECQTNSQLSETSYTPGSVVPCICPNDSTRIIYYRCFTTENSATWSPITNIHVNSDDYDVSNIHGIIPDEAPDTNKCYACGKGNFLVDTTCYSCAKETGIKGATTDKEAVVGVYNCKNNINKDQEDEKGTFKYVANCYFTCTNNNDPLCKSNA